MSITSFRSLGRDYVLTDTRQVCTPDGKVYILNTWKGECAACGAGYTFTSTAKINLDVLKRRCRGCKAPGVKVAPLPKTTPEYGREYGRNTGKNTRFLTGGGGACPYSPNSKEFGV